MTFAFNGFRAWKLKTDGIKIVSVEDIAIVTSDGATYLIESQEELILILNR